MPLENPPTLEPEDHSALLRKCDLIALTAGLLGLALRFCDFSERIPSGPARFSLSLLHVLLCSLSILAGYAIAHKTTGVYWSELIPTTHCGILKRFSTIVLAALFLSILVSMINLVIIQLFHIDSEASNPLVGHLKEVGWAIRIWLLVEIVFLAPIFEEFFFRLALPRWLGSSAFAEFNASLLFALLQSIIWGIPGLTVFALAQCSLRRRQDIFSCIGVHSLYNLILAIIVFLN